MSDSPELSSITSPRIVRIFTVIAALTIAFFGSFIWHVWDTFRYIETTQRNYFRLNELTGYIVHLDEALTMSARMAAATGDQTWEERYRWFEPKLDAAIKEVLLLGLELPLKDSADETKLANLKLVAMENQAFHLIRRGQAGKAAAILSSAEYDIQKKSYITGITKITEKIRGSLQEDVTKYRYRVYFAIGSILIITPCLIFGWILVVRLIRKYNAERKQAEEALYSSQLQLAEAADIARIAHWEFDLATETFVFNDALYALYGTNAEQEGGYRMTREDYAKRFVHPDDLPKHYKYVEENTLRADPGLTGDIEHRIVRRDGEVRHILVRTKIVKDDSGRIIKRYGANQDITERKQAEEELRKHRDHLEELVNERTALLTTKTKELTENQLALTNIVEELNDRTAELALAKERAEGADKLKSAFLATMSHELRTPLNSILGFTGIALQGMSGPLNDEQAKQLGMVQGSANHLLALINDVLDISKIEAGQVEILRRSFNMRSVIDEAVRTVMPLAVKKGISLDIAIASDVGPIISDQRRVVQILINLVNNAVKFTERGDVRIECRIKGGRLETCVRDTGIGIKPEEMDKLFKPFSQIETGLTRGYEGTGLGLSICGKLLEMLGGTIRVESEWGKGSAFTFTLPL